MLVLSFRKPVEKFDVLVSNCPAFDTELVIAPPCPSHITVPVSIWNV
jgi:hypothetical protein